MKEGTETPPDIVFLIFHSSTSDFLKKHHRGKSQSIGFEVKWKEVLSASYLLYALCDLGEVMGGAAREKKMSS